MLKLVEVGSSATLAALSSALQEEPNWRVRVHVAEALSHTIPVIAMQVLARMVKSEEDPRAMWAVFRAAGEVKDINVKKALNVRYGDHLKVPLPPKATAELMHSLGNQGGDDVLEALLFGLRDAEDNCMTDVEFKGYVQGLAGHHSRRAFEVLLAMAPYGAHKRWGCRSVSLDALVECSLWQETHLQQHAVEQVRMSLHDQSEEVRRTAAESLVKLKVEGAHALLEALKATFPLQEHSWSTP